ncbi:MAG TPA: sodium ion-translocating decarboxylase subunit beta [Ignavibacteriales bacterium]|nr:sodium ion-translocating decarboxylase subunit beta [Ignavibacteriales bacterium]HOL81912.1 sodium ion-translocating decarboxylase subunit beta [Ignavibacteriales bacterium]HOM65964.1 sodium ion-translocating decarboxylase subunit beta [Ignavibacteriales bacterium]HPD67496.1 sodium ion-translocating decarboxylase subunit beta [Ignavibacteriales bacterium]HPP34049.1 sodium ion-translocating decarboxylase subunit beta [Ignavibacteriales bacterium]
MFEVLTKFINGTGFGLFTTGELIMILISFILMYLAIKKDFEPLLLLPIAMGAFITNLPLNGLLNEPSELNDFVGGLFYYISYGIKLEIFPPIIFLGIGAMTDFGPLLANPRTFLLGAAAQFGVFAALFMAVMLGFNLNEAAAIGIIGGADGPTAIFLTLKLAPHLLGPIAVAAYSYMALIPLIQPPIMKFMTTKEERMVVMEPPKQVSKNIKIMFPIIVMLLTTLIVPPVAPLIFMLMGGNLLRESGVVERLSNMAQNELINIVTFFLGVCVGLTMKAEQFLRFDTIKIIVLGVFAFGFSTVGGLILGKIMFKISGGKINPLIGSAGVSAVPMAARVSHNVAQEENPQNYLIMHAMGPNVAGVIGTAVAAGVLLSYFAK